MGGAICREDPRSFGMVRRGARRVRRAATSRSGGPGGGGAAELASLSSLTTGPNDFALRRLDLLCVWLLATVHGVQMTGNVNLKKESPFALRTLEILTLAPSPGATNGWSGLNLTDPL